MKNTYLPKDWDPTAHNYWNSGKKQAAINALLSVINSYGEKKPVELSLQLCYYIFLSGDPASAAQFLMIVKKDYPDDLRVLQNLAVCLGLSGQYEKALQCWQEFLAIQPDSYLAYDSLARCFAMLERYEEASAAGTHALALKDQQHGILQKEWQLPNIRPAEFIASNNKKNVISFSLWGANPCYLRGALDNMLAAPTVYPGWILRFYVDDSVPLDLRNALASLGAEIILEPKDQSNLERLTWRFKVANDPSVGRFLVRDVDSVINYRERNAVQEWISSDCWFHIMRDWWSHTDLILAGMWGGIAGVLPNLTAMITVYQPPSMETLNIDQWFLRDKIWAYVRVSCYVHDRCFNSFGAKPWPDKKPEGNIHVGQDVFAAQKQEQEKRLEIWLSKIKGL